MVHYQLLIKQNGANYYTVNHVTGEKKNKTKSLSWPVSGDINQSKRN